MQSSTSSPVSLASLTPAWVAGGGVLAARCRVLVNVAPHLPGDPSPYPLFLGGDAVFHIFARIPRLVDPGLGGQVVHQSVDRAAELGAAAHSQADDLANASQRVCDAVLAPEP